MSNVSVLLFSAFTNFALPYTKHAQILIIIQQMQNLCIWTVTFEGFPSKLQLTTFDTLFHYVRC
jgi:hypothetical protein